MSLRVGLNLIFLGERAGGIGRYAQGLLRGLASVEDAPRITAIVGSGFPDRLRSEPWSGAVDWVRLPVAPGNPLHLVAQAAAIPAIARRRRLQVVHSLANAGPPRVPGAATVLTLHDLIWLHHAEEWSDSRRARVSARVLFVRSARAADRVIAVSEAAKRDFVETLGLPSGRIDVTPQAGHGAGAVALPEPELRRRLRLGDRPFLLCVAQMRRYKRLDAAIRAVAELAPDGPGLVLVGEPTAHERELRELASALGAGDRVRFLGWVEEEELEGLYRSCVAFVLPSLIEGFGLPVLEAMHRGAPVACSDRTSLPEVAGDAALLFDPDDQAAVTAALRRVYEDEGLRRRLAEAGPAQARRFSWARTAEATMASYRRALAGR